jgi:hypothetical protein
MGIVVDDQPGFCADCVVNPVCVDGRWQCVEDTIPHELCSGPGAPCRLDEGGVVRLDLKRRCAAVLAVARRGVERCGVGRTRVA